MQVCEDKWLFLCCGFYNSSHRNNSSSRCCTYKSPKGILAKSKAEVITTGKPETALGGGSIVIHKNGQPLLASGGVALGKAGGTLTQLALDQAVGQAIDFWGLHGIDADAAVNLQQIHVELADRAQLPQQLATKQ